MDVPTLGRDARLRTLDDCLDQIARVVWCGALAACLVLCALLAVRRLEGQFRQPLRPLALLAVGLAGSLAVGALRLTWPHHVVARPCLREIGQRFFAPSCGLLLLGMSLSLPDSSKPALAVFWATIVGAEIAWWYGCLRGQAGWLRGIVAPLQRMTTRRAMALPVAFQRLGQDPPEGVEVSDEEDEELESLPAEVTQQWTRLRVGDEGELVFGLVRAAFGAGERSQNLHLSFCPPLEGPPMMTVEQVAGPTVTIKPALAESYGARLELKLAAKPAQAETVVVRFEALWQPAASGGDG